MSRPGLVVFDLDGTLVDQQAAVRRWVDEFIAAHDVDPALHPWLVSQLTARTPKDEVFAAIATRARVRQHPTDLWEDYRTRMPSLVTLFPRAEESLRALRAAGWMLGIATNGMPDNQIGKIRRTGLDELVDGWVVSGDVGFRKPDPQLLRALADQLTVPLEGWMVGDGLESDVAAGHAAGLRTAWIVGEDAEGAEGDADVIVPDVAAFAEFVLRG